MDDIQDTSLNQQMPQQPKPDKPKKTAHDWVRDMRMSADVNAVTVGVNTERVTPELLMATSKKLLGISRREQEEDYKDSLLFQRFYGPAEYFAEHILRDAGKLGRNLLWKATNKGNLDFMQPSVLDQHVSDVFYDSKLAQMIDASSPLETVDASYKTTRIGEGGVQDMESAPDIMRIVQPSFFGYLDPVRCFTDDMEIYTKTGWISVKDMTMDTEFATVLDGRLEWQKPTELHEYDYSGTICVFRDRDVGYSVTPNHNMLACELRPDYRSKTTTLKYRLDETELSDCKFVPVMYLFYDGDWCMFTGTGKPALRDESATTFKLSAVGSCTDQEDIDTVDIFDFAEYMGWFLSAGDFSVNIDTDKHCVTISHGAGANPYNYEQLVALVEHMPFATEKHIAESNKPKTLTIYSARLASYLQQLRSCDEKFIPEWILNAPVKARERFIGAILKASGKAHRHLLTASKRLAEDFARLLTEMGESITVVNASDTGALWQVYWRKSIRKRQTRNQAYADKKKGMTLKQYNGKVYCPTVPGNIVYVRLHSDNPAKPYTALLCSQSPESTRVGLDMWLSKNCMKGSDGKLYQKFIDAKTGKTVLVDSVTASRSVVASKEMMNTNTRDIFAMGGPTGVRIVPKKSVDYYLANSDDAFSTAANMVPMPSAVKEMRLLMGCLHPYTNVININKKNELDIVYAKDLGADNNCVPGCTETFAASNYAVRTTVAKFPKTKKYFKKVTLRSGRTLITSYDHRWPIIKDGKQVLVEAKDLRKGDIALRSSFRNLTNRRTFLNGKLVNADVAILLGYITRTLVATDKTRYRAEYQPRHAANIKAAIARLEVDFPLYVHKGLSLINLRDPQFFKWIEENICIELADRKIPSVILSAHADIAMHFLDAYMADETKVGIDSNEDLWILHIPNNKCRDGLALLLSRCMTDTLYRDAVSANGTELALKLVAPDNMCGDMYIDRIKAVQDVANVPIMIDIDINDNLYATASGVVTHNSKYPLQGISIKGREAPLVRGLDEATGKDMPTLTGKYLGARFADKGGVVTAVRRDRIDVIYDDGSKGSVALYNNFPMNAKGYIENTPQVKAGQSFKKGQCLASSNYTDRDGVTAIGTNLRTGWISWKGGTFEDGITISESAAKDKLVSTTMYRQSVDLDKTVKLGKNNYVTWKPGEYKKEQLEGLDDTGVVKPGTILRKGDPMILAVQTAEPSPGTMGKRILTDVSEKWEHDHEGVVTDVVKTRKGVKVFTTVTAPCEIGDKLSNSYGAKGVIAAILPDEQMPKDEKGQPLELLFSPLSLVSRTNPAMLHEALLGKVAKKIGKPITVPAFYDGDLYKFVEDMCKQYHVKESETLTDPDTGRQIPGILTGVSHIYKLKHLTESKMSARGTEEYSQDGVPAGSGDTKSKRYGSLEQSALVGHNAFAHITDAKLLRGQSNADFWRSIRTGEIPVMPGEPLVHKKFFAHLTGSGVNVRKTPKGISVFSLSTDDVNELAGPRELKSRDTYEAKTFRPLDGGLFGQDVFGINGDKWGYIQLDEPMPNPVMEEPLSRLLKISEKDFIAVASGKKEVNGMKSPDDIKARLEQIDLKKESMLALQEFKTASKSKKDAALKRYVAIENMRRQGVSPDKYMLDRIPVLPPIFRPISTHSGLTMVADSNYLYAQLLDSRDDFREAKNLPEEYQQQARETLYRHWKELTGLYDPENVKLKNKHVRGLLKWALGDSPKFSSFQRKVLGSTVDTVGRGVVVPNPRLKINELGIPKDMAFGIFGPFVSRMLVKSGYTPVEAMKQVKDQTEIATDKLKKVLETSPVAMNRAPTLHKLGIMGFMPKLVPGHSIHVSPSIVSPFGMDFDGDTVWNLTMIGIRYEEILRKIKIFGISCLTLLEKSVYYSIEQPSTNNKKNETMLSKEAKATLINATMSLQDLPKVAGSEVKKSDTVTEWDVQPGYYTDTIDPTTWERSVAEITKVSKHSNLKMFDCVASISGCFKYTITASEDHSLITFNGDTMQLEKTKPIEAVGKLSPKVQYNAGNETDCSIRGICLDNRHYDMNYKLGVFFGLMIGDGWVDPNLTTRIACCTESLQEYILNALSVKNSPLPVERDAKLFTYPTDPQRFSQNDKQRITVYLSRGIAIDLKEYIGCGALNKRIPAPSFGASRAHMVGILMGLLATDGTVSVGHAKGKKAAIKTIIIHTISPDLRDGIHNLCLRLGIKASATPYMGPHSKSTCYAVSLSVEDMVREYRKHPKYYVIPEATKQAAFMDMVADAGTAKKGANTYKLLPMPRAIFCELSYAGISKLFSSSEASRFFKQGFIAKPHALKLAKHLEENVSWMDYTCPSYIKKADRTNRTPDEAKAIIDKWIAMVRDDSIDWMQIESVTPSTCTEGWDCTVPGPYTFALSNGLIVQDTVNIHAPVSDAAKRETIARMFPERNLISMRNRSILYKPEKEYVQGLYVGSRIKQGPDVRTRTFSSLEEARDAHNQGLIDIDDPIIIKKQ